MMGRPAQRHSPDDGGGLHGDEAEVRPQPEPGDCAQKLVQYCLDRLFYTPDLLNMLTNQHSDVTDTRTPVSVQVGVIFSHG